MDILDIFLDILLKPPQPLIGLFLVQGFRQGFNLGYRGPVNRRNTASNIPFKPGIGDKHDMWSKIMKEVQAKRYAVPYRKIPFDSYIQSPIGLVPKAGGKTRLIFHLSYNFSMNPEDQSVNSFIPREDCSVRYNDLDAVVHACLKMRQCAIKAGHSLIIYLSKSDFLSAFRQVPLNKRS